MTKKEVIKKANSMTKMGIKVLDAEPDKGFHLSLFSGSRWILTIQRADKSIEKCIATESDFEYQGF